MTVPSGLNPCELYVGKGCFAGYKATISVSRTYRGPGTLMVISDHINLTGRSPLIGRNADQLGPRFPDLTEAWSPRLRAALHAAGRAEGIRLEEGTYGRCFESRRLSDGVSFIGFWRK